MCLNNFMKKQTNNNYEYFWFQFWLGSIHKLFKTVVRFAVRRILRFLAPIIFSKMAQQHLAFCMQINGRWAIGPFSRPIHNLDQKCPWSLFTFGSFFHVFNWTLVMKNKPIAKHCAMPYPQLTDQQRVTSKIQLQGYFWDGPELFYEKTINDKVILISFLVGPLPYAI